MAEPVTARSAREDRITRLLDWKDRDKAWFLCLLTVPLHFVYLAWGFISLKYTDFGHHFMDPAVTRLACLYAFVAILGWACFAAWGSILRHRDVDSSLFVNTVIMCFGLSQLPLAYWSGLAGPMTGVILLGATMTGFVLFGFWRVLIAFFVNLAVLVLLAFLSARDVLPYAPMFRTDPISQIYVSSYYTVSQFMLGTPFVTSAFVICYMLLNRWKRREEQAQRLATTDFLTGVANRRALGEALEHAYLRARRHGQVLSVVMVDLDHFKRINDQYGHDMGDRVLVSSARALVSQIREVDMVGRMGGEEFVLLLPDTDEAAAHLVAERCRLAVEDICESVPDGESLTITASFGLCALAADQVQSAQRYLTLADEALYRAKAEGRNRIEVYRDSDSVSDDLRRPPQAQD